ncbi:hypothetical protein DYD21_03370 [Rhodohalobacter sp. SW132]|uniref:hypothetical protein n=1 Tax=Rhodohalobacter sp. SW132 TaxID=2293433 RepID=UPI000E2463AE|nr:hypothetical protein [Rhodohalobacter sp. SW132]REL39008.1 hypothetical protein DYD21_03370 [Rhodohalobacter sp. SW132]
MKNPLILFLLLLLIPGTVFSQQVYLLYDESVPQAAYSADRLGSALSDQGYSISTNRSEYDLLINIGVNEVNLDPEAFEIIPEQDRFLTIYGGDEAGMVYGSLAVVERLGNGVALQDIERIKESPKFSFRAIKHNMPWDTYRPSMALDQHYDTARELDYWEAFLDMMAENRFNALSLWMLHPFTYMIMPENFPEASQFSEEELDEWRELFSGIFGMAKARGIDTYIVNWSIFVSEEFSKAHDVAHDNFYPHYYVEGDTTEIVKRYTRESVTQVLNEYPDLSGFAISHGEGMAGMTPQQRQDWMDETMIEGMRLADRPVKFIHRVPFSAGTGSEGSTSEHVEKLTREAMEKLDYFDGPIWVEMKFNWSHAHSTPELVKVHGGELGDTYFEPEPENYKITWMARNEDFFALRWGVPDFIRAHIETNDASYIGGYFIGSETYIPAKDYFTKIDDPVDWDYAFQRQWLFYKQWGRLLYDPKTPDDVFEREFIRRYGERGENLQEAFALASSTPLRLASAWDLRWDFTLYSEGFLSLNENEDDYESSTMDYISVDRLISRPPLDPNYVSVKEYVEANLSGESFGDDAITPTRLIDMLEEDCRRALELVEGIDTEDNASLMYEVSDVKTWAYLGLHFADKLKGAIALETFRQQGGESYQQEAVGHLENALGHWDEVVRITRPIYKDMHLTHYMGGGFDRDDERLFHWEHIRPEVAEDVEIARNAAAGETVRNGD